MNRRKFIFGGGLLSTLAAFGSESEPETGPVQLCANGHEPMLEYTGSYVAIMIHAPNDPAAYRPLQPCRRCGVLFAIPIKRTM